MIGRDYFPLWYRLGHRDRYMIWFSEYRPDDDGDHDGVFVAPDGRVPAFDSLDELRAYAAAHGIGRIDEEPPALHDLDALERWLRSKSRTRSGHINCETFLSAWNLFMDLSRSVGGSFDADHDHARRVYLKLFHGNNLPAVTPPGEQYVPYWPGREVRLMHQVLADGLRLFRASVKRAR